MCSDHSGLLRLSDGALFGNHARNTIRAERLQQACEVSEVSHGPLCFNFSLKNEPGWDGYHCLVFQTYSYISTVKEASKRESSSTHAHVCCSKTFKAQFTKQFSERSAWKCPLTLAGCQLRVPTITNVYYLFKYCRRWWVHSGHWRELAAILWLRSSGAARLFVPGVGVREPGVAPPAAAVGSAEQCAAAVVI